MILNFEQFRKSVEQVEKIMDSKEDLNLKNEIEIVAEGINDVQIKRELFRHMSSLFLNYILNRLNEVGEEGEKKAIKARNIIVELTDNL
jgi:hypothetical protein